MFFPNLEAFTMCMRTSHKPLTESAPHANLLDCQTFNMHLLQEFQQFSIWNRLFICCWIQDGRVICTSLPIYGEGKEAGNEAGYIVGMSTCYPKPGSVKIADGENLTLESNYSSTQTHTGVMGLFYILVADQTPNPVTPLQTNHAHVSWKKKGKPPRSSQS